MTAIEVDDAVNKLIFNDMACTHKTIDITEYIKVEKNSRGYNYEVKTFGLDVAKIKAVIDALNKEYASVMQ